MAPPTNLEKAEADRVALKEHLEFLETELVRHNTIPLNQHEVDMYLMEIEETRKLLTPNHAQIALHTARGTDLAPAITEYRRLSQLSSRVHAGLHGLRMSFPPPSIPSSSTAAVSTQNIKLPRLELPKFSGNLQEWVSFRDLFITAVHNSSLTNVEKLTQLKSLLTGEAARQVRSLPLSDTNYNIAWTSLKERYENNRELLFSILKRLLGQPVLTNSSAAHLRSLIDTTRECVRQLEILSIPSQHWDAILLFIIFSKLDGSSRELWEQSLDNTDIPPLSKMYDFVEQRARALAASTVQPPRQNKPQQQGVRVNHAATSKCSLGCDTDHPLYKCTAFINQLPQQRNETVKRMKHCINCLQNGHFQATCPSSYRCKKCNGKHHTMLHMNNVLPQQNEQPPPKADKVVNHHAYNQRQHGNHIDTGVLATARISISTQFGPSLVRALIDGGSTNTHITEAAARRMNLTLRPCHIPITGLDETSLGTANHITNFNISPHHDPSIAIAVTAIVVRSIGGHIPTSYLDHNKWKHLSNLTLADPYFYQPSCVDVLLGADIVWDILIPGKRRGRPKEPVAINTTLGWLVAGQTSTATTVRVNHTSSDLDYLLQRFWEQEETSDTPLITEEEAKCEEIFTTTYQRDPSGRYMVHLPFSQSEPDIGSSRHIAQRRFLSMERKFSNRPTPQQQTQWEAYKLFMQEYEQLGHMKPVSDDDVATKSYYIPHHSVMKESSTTTKLRVVFDASAVTSNGRSLNDCLLNGPQLQDSIWSIMLRFRLPAIAFTADIAKMYRQINVVPSHQDFQRILWRSNPNQPLKDYRLCTVTYGTKSAPYLAVKTLQQHAQNEKERFPKGARVALHDFYVDDTASGCDTLTDAVDTVQQLRELCASGGFELRKWTSNSAELLATIPGDLHETQPLVDIQVESTVKTLGIYWNPQTDTYHFKVSVPPVSGTETKRMVLSQIAKIFDPLGWLSPVIINCKIFMQEIWKLKLGWDESLSTSTMERWKHISQMLIQLDQIVIPRHIKPTSPNGHILVGCCDASIRAISAAVYLCTKMPNGTSSCYIVTSKTRAAPIRLVTLPRLELEGAVLLSKLLKSVQLTLNICFNQTRAFTDSTITLSWLSAAPEKWKPYIRRRVQRVHDNIPTTPWYHIPGTRNPADCASRGISTADLITHPLWWHGCGDFLSPSPHHQLLKDEEDIVNAEQQRLVYHLQPRLIHPLLLRFSSFNKLQRVIAYVFRFIKNWCNKRKGQPLATGLLTVEELETSRLLIIRHLQHQFFSEELNDLSNGEQISSTSKIYSLQPFVGHDSILRVGGRLRHAPLHFNQKHQMLLPKHHHITSLIISEFHHRELHAGPAATLAALQQQYWIVNGRDVVRRQLKRCFTCAKHRTRMLNQLMGDLPVDRVTPSRPFQKIGIDYAGPFHIKPMVRSKVTLKCWLSIFVCFSTRAIHVEPVTSLSSECFLAALKRFTSRRGVPSDVYTDNGTNFKGADKILSEFYTLFISTDVQNAVAAQRIAWHFIPAAAPHFGGLWEAGVKSIKYHLYRIMGQTKLTYEEFNTLVVQIEGILNSRPLIPASVDPSDLSVLTPAHFLIGSELNALPEPGLQNAKVNHLQRWQLIQQQQQHFWNRWSKEFLTRLQQRPKWNKEVTNIQVGHLVIIKEDNLPPREWRLGRVIATHPGADGHVRVVTLKTANGEVRRPIVKLSLLPIITATHSCSQPLE